MTKGRKERIGWLCRRITITGQHMHGHRPLVPRWFMYILTRDPSRTGAGESGTGNASFIPSPLSLCLVASPCVPLCVAKVETTLHRRCRVACVVARTSPPSIPVRSNGPGPVQYSVPERKTSTGNQGRIPIVVTDEPLRFRPDRHLSSSDKERKSCNMLHPNHIPSREAHQSLCGINKKRTTR